MQNRTVRVQGWGLGVANLTATLDDVEIFSGNVELEEFQPDTNASEQTAPTLFSFEIPMDFKGVKSMKIVCESGQVRLGQIVANFSTMSMGGIGYGSGPDIFMDVADYDTNYCRDPRDNVKINGLAQKVDRSKGSGAWHWHLGPKDVIEHDLKIDIVGSED